MKCPYWVCSWCSSEPFFYPHSGPDGGRGLHVHADYTQACTLEKHHPGGHEWGAPKGPKVMSKHTCSACGNEKSTGTFSIVCLTCRPEYSKPCGFCGTAFLHCRCDGVPSHQEAAFADSWRPPRWSESAQAFFAAQDVVKLRPPSPELKYDIQVDPARETAWSPGIDGPKPPSADDLIQEALDPDVPGEGPS